MNLKKGKWSSAYVFRRNRVNPDIRISDDMGEEVAIIRRNGNQKRQETIAGLIVGMMNSGLIKERLQM